MPELARTGLRLASFCNRNVTNSIRCKKWEPSRDSRGSGVHGLFGGSSLSTVECAVCERCFLSLQAVRAVQGTQVRTCPRPQEEPRLQGLSATYWPVWATIKMKNIPHVPPCISFNAMRQNYGVRDWRFQRPAPPFVKRGSEGTTNDVRRAIPGIGRRSSGEKRE